MASQRTNVEIVIARQQPKFVVVNVILVANAAQGLVRHTIEGMDEITPLDESLERDLPDFEPCP